MKRTKNTFKRESEVKVGLNVKFLKVNFPKKNIIF